MSSVTDPRRPRDLPPEVRVDERGGVDLDRASTARRAAAALWRARRPRRAPRRRVVGVVVVVDKVGVVDDAASSAAAGCACRCPLPTTPPRSACASTGAAGAALRRRSGRPLPARDALRPRLAVRGRLPRRRAGRISAGILARLRPLDRRRRALHGLRARYCYEMRGWNCVTPRERSTRGEPAREQLRFSASRCSRPVHVENCVAATATAAAAAAIVYVLKRRREQRLISADDHAHPTLG